MRTYKAWREWLNDRTDNKEENLKRLDQGIKLEKKGHGENDVMDQKEIIKETRCYQMQ